MRESPTLVWSAQARVCPGWDCQIGPLGRKCGSKRLVSLLCRTRVITNYRLSLHAARVVAFNHLCGLGGMKMDP